MNQPLDRATAEAIDAIFTEIIIAPSYEDGVLDLLQQKKNRRLLEVLPGGDDAALDVRTAAGGLLVQDAEPAARHGRGAARALLRRHEARADGRRVGRPRLRVARLQARQVATPSSTPATARRSASGPGR